MYEAFFDFMRLSATFLDFAKEHGYLDKQQTFNPQCDLWVLPDLVMSHAPARGKDWPDAHTLRVDLPPDADLDDWLKRYQPETYPYT
jgi:hypothetical protein